MSRRVKLLIVILAIGMPSAMVVTAVVRGWRTSEIRGMLADRNTVYARSVVIDHRDSTGLYLVANATAVFDGVGIPDQFHGTEHVAVWCPADSLKSAVENEMSFTKRGVGGLTPLLQGFVDVVVIDVANDGSASIRKKVAINLVRIR